MESQRVLKTVLEDVYRSLNDVLIFVKLLFYDYY